MLLDADELLALPFLGPRVAKSAASTPVGRCATHACDADAHCHAPRTVPCTTHCTTHHTSCTDPNHAPCTVHYTTRRTPPCRPGERFVSPVSVPKLPGRYYFLFGEPIPTGGVDAADREACAALYTKVQAELRTPIPTTPTPWCRARGS